MPKPWFVVKAQAGQSGQSAPELAIRGVIGDYGLTDAALAAEISALGPIKALTVRINSIGGDAAVALAVFNYLRGLNAEITVRVDGVAMSSGSVIAMAASPGKLIMPANTIMMLHHPWTITAGNAKELRTAAADLDVWSAALIETYMGRSQMTRAQLDAFLDEERSLTAAEAVAMGFADVVEPLNPQSGQQNGNQARASISRSVMAYALGVDAATLDKIHAIEAESAAPQAQVQTQTQAQIQQPQAPTLASQIKAEAEAQGLGEYAMVFALDNRLNTLEAAKTRITEASEILSLAKLAGYPEIGANIVKAGGTRMQACEQLTNARAMASDALVTDGHLPHESIMQAYGQQDRRSAVNGLVQEVWHARRR